MKDYRQFYIDGKWVNPVTFLDCRVINPANEQPIATISLGAPADVAKAVAAARKAFLSYSETTVDQRLAILEKIIEIYRSKIDEMAETISMEWELPPGWLRPPKRLPGSRILWRL